MARKSWLLPMIALLVSCASTPVFVRPPDSSLILGSTTADEVVHLAGNPTYRRYLNSNARLVEVLHYGEAGLASARSMNFYLFDGVLVGRTFNSSYASDRTRFDEDALASLSNGMSESEATALLGMPSGELRYPLVSEKGGKALVYGYYGAGGAFALPKRLVVELDAGARVRRAYYDDKPMVCTTPECAGGFGSDQEATASAARAPEVSEEDRAAQRAVVGRVPERALSNDELERAQALVADLQSELARVVQTNAGTLAGAWGGIRITENPQPLISFDAASGRFDLHLTSSSSVAFLLRHVVSHQQLASRGQLAIAGVPTLPLNAVDLRIEVSPAAVHVVDPEGERWTSSLVLNTADAQSAGKIDRLLSELLALYTPGAP